MTFSTNLGSIGQAGLINGIAHATLTSGTQIGIITVSVKADNQIVQIPVTVKDTISPTVNITYPILSGYVNGLVNIAAIVSDNVGVTNVVFNTSSGYSSNGNIGSYGWGSTWDTTNIPDGVYSISVTAYDGANNNQSESINVTVDNTKPTVTANLASGIYNSLQSVTLNADDNFDANPIIQYFIVFNGKGSPWYIQTKAITLNLNQGITTIYYMAVDLTGNQSPLTLNTYTIDTTAPTVSADVSSGIYNSIKSVTLNAADNLDTNPLIYYSTDNRITWNNQQNMVKLNINQGITELSYYAMDSAGNIGITQTNTYTIDTTLPTATTNLASGIYDTIKSVTLNAADNLNNPLIYYSTDNGATWNNQPNTITLNLNEGKTSLMYYAIDAAGNQCPTQTNTYTIDTTLPTATTNLASGIYDTIKSVTLNAADNLNNPLIYYSTDNGATWNNQPNTITLNLNEGKTSLMYYAIDAAGNQCPTQTNIYTITPIANADINSGLYNINKVISLSMSEPGTIYYTLDGSTPSTTSTPILRANYNKFNFYFKIFSNGFNRESITSIHTDLYNR